MVSNSIIIFQFAAILLLPKVCDDRNLAVSNRTLGLPGIGEDAFHFLCSGILNKDLLEFLPLSHDHDEFSLTVSITEATDRN